MEKYNSLESTVRNTLASVVWSHKIQEKQADIYTSRYRFFETIRIVASGITSVGLISLVFKDAGAVKIICAMVSLVSFCVSAFFKSFNLNTMVNEHKQAATQLLSVRDGLIMLILQIRMRNLAPDALYSEFEQLMEKLHKIYCNAPITTDKAVDMARTALKVTEDNTFSDQEIDSYLPKELRKGADGK